MIGEPGISEYVELEHGVERCPQEQAWIQRIEVRCLTGGVEVNDSTGDWEDVEESRVRTGKSRGELRKGRCEETPVMQES